MLENEQEEIDAVNKMRLTLDGADWRWKRAKQRVDESTRRPTAKDDIVQRMASLLWLELRGPLPVHELPDDFEDWVGTFRQAQSIRLDRRDRIILESLLLSRCDPKETQAIMNVPEEVIACFEACYFNVLSLDIAPSALIGIAIELPEAGREDPMRSAILRLALTGGPVATPACIDYLRHFDEGHDLSTQIGQQRTQFELMVKAEAIRFGNDPLEQLKQMYELERVHERLLILPTVSDLMMRQVTNAIVKAASIPGQQHDETDQSKRGVRPLERDDDSRDREVVRADQVLESTSFDAEMKADKKSA